MRTCDTTSMLKASTFECTFVLAALLRVFSPRSPNDEKLSFAEQPEFLNSSLAKSTTSSHFGVSGRVLLGSMLLLGRQSSKDFCPSGEHSRRASTRFAGMSKCLHRGDSSAVEENRATLEPFSCF